MIIQWPESFKYIIFWGFALGFLNRVLFYPKRWEIQSWLILLPTYDSDRTSAEVQWYLRSAVFGLCSVADWAPLWNHNEVTARENWCPWEGLLANRQKTNPIKKNESKTEIIYLFSQVTEQKDGKFLNLWSLSLNSSKKKVKNGPEMSKAHLLH